MNKKYLTALRLKMRMTLGQNGQYKTKIDMAKNTIHNLKNWILADGVICKDKLNEGWGLYGKPHSLNYISSSENILNFLFTNKVIESDLKELIHRQKEDGKWDTGYGISEGTKLEWAGMQTLWVLKTLKNFNKIENHFIIKTS